MNGIADSYTSLKVESADTALQRGVQRALHGAGDFGLRNIQATAHEGLVQLRGSVKTYYLKQLAQTVAMRTTGVDVLQNDIVVG